MIVGFPNETEDDHKQTISLMNEVTYLFGYMFKYSERPGTLAERKLEDIIDKLPGVEINDSGQIEVEGKVVNKLMVNGKDLSLIHI